MALEAACSLSASPARGGTPMGSPSLPGSIFHASPPRSPSGLRFVASRCPCVLDRSTHDRACGMQWWHARGRWACRYRWICSHSCSRLQPGRHPFHHRARTRTVIGMTVYEDVCAVGRNAAGFAARARSRGTPSSSKSARKNLLQPEWRPRCLTRSSDGCGSSEN